MGLLCSKQSAERALLSTKHFQYRFVFSIDQNLEDRYEIVEPIGEGSTAKIHKVKMKPQNVPKSSSSRSMSCLQSRGMSSRIESFGHESTTKYYALKEIDNSCIKPQIMDEFENEVKLLKGLDHPHIVRPLEIFRSHHNRVTAIVMEMCEGGNLYSRPPCSERDAATIVEQVLSAVAYLHARNIVHRDIKYQNILYVDKVNLDVKLIDFGLAKKYLLKSDRHYERCGTRYTMSPEATQGNYSGSSTDLWSIGVITWMLLSNEKPFDGNTPRELIQQINYKPIRFDSKVWEKVSTHGEDFVMQLLQRDPELRPTAKQALKHEFIRKRSKLSRDPPDPDVLKRIPGSLVHYGECSDIKKVALQIIASRSSSEEIFELRQIFEEYDKACEGSLSYKDFKACLSHMNYVDDEIKRMFDLVDENRSGRIQYTEFLASTLEAQGNISKHKVADAFRHVDLSSKGFINKEDLRKVLPKTATDKEIDDIFSQIGDQQKGRISLQQFSTALTSSTETKIGQVYNNHKPLR